MKAPGSARCHSQRIANNGECEEPFADALLTRLQRPRVADDLPRSDDPQRAQPLLRPGECYDEDCVQTLGDDYRDLVGGLPRQVQMQERGRPG
jgi:hypothetical protein